MTKFKGRFRVETTRLRNWDYSASGWYFVTTCTKDQNSFLGEILDGEMHLSQVGKIVSEEWTRTETCVPMSHWVNG